MADRYFYKDMIQVGAALERLHASMWRTVPVVARVGEVRRKASGSPRFAGGIGWGMHKRNSVETLYEAVVRSRLALFAWPTRADSQGVRQPEEAAEALSQIPVGLIERLRPLHGGPPSTFVGGRQPILNRFRDISATDMPVFVGLEFKRWFKDERCKSTWATQRPLDAEDNRARSPRKPGRPSLYREVEHAIEAIVTDGEWNRGEAVSRLGRIVRIRGIKANDDTVRKVLDSRYVWTGDSRYRSRFFDRRNPGTFQR